MTQIQNSQPTEGGTVWCRCGDSCETDREKYYRLCETCWMLAADEYYANQAQAAEPSPQSIAVDYRRILEIAVNIPESKRPIVEQLFVRAIERGRVYRMRQDLTEEQRRTDAVLVLADMHRKYDMLWRDYEKLKRAALGGRYEGQ